MNTKCIFLFLSPLFIVLFLVPFSAGALTVEITATVLGCGNGIIDPGEQCDGSNLGGASCTSLGFSGGTLSCSSACTFITSGCTSAPGGGGGGGGGGGSSIPIIPDTNVVFTGRAYPLSRVSILKDGQLVVTTIAGPDSNFTATISGLSSGNYTFSLYGEDRNNIRSDSFTFSVYITSGVTTKIGGIFIVPTLAADKSEVKRGDNIAFFGQSASDSEVTISINSEHEIFIKKIADADGIYLLNFDSSLLLMGQHNSKSKSAIDGEISLFSRIVNFLVGTKNVFAKPQTSVKGDLNADGRINLVDFSIAAFWYKKILSTTFKSIEIEWLNGDGKVDLADFSIMAFYWTG